MKHGGDAAARTASTFLGATGLESRAVGAGISQLYAASTGTPGPPPLPLATIFHTFGIAALDLSPQDIHRVSASGPEILGVVPNEILTIPEPELRQARLRGSFSAARPPAPRDSDRGDIASKYESKLEDISKRSGRLRRHMARTTPGTVSESAMTWPLEMIGLSSRTQLTGHDVGLCVIDTGLDLDHPDFSGRVATDDAKSFVGGSVQDIRGHGTHCAGSAAGPASTAHGQRYGVACDSRLLVAKVFSDSNDGASTSDILAAMEWGYHRGARILSMSLGSERDPGDPVSATYERVASILLNEGVLVVAAAGNESRRSSGHIAAVGSPAACQSVLAVAAVEQDGAVSDFSCGAVDDIGDLGLAAPGGNILSSVPGGGYDALSGTSMACPHVAGLAALYMQAHPSASATDIQQLMINSAESRSPHRDFGHGLAKAP